MNDWERQVYEDHIYEKLPEFPELVHSLAPYRPVERVAFDNLSHLAEKIPQEADSYVDLFVKQLLGRRGRGSPRIYYEEACTLAGVIYYYRAQLVNQPGRTKYEVQYIDQFMNNWFSVIAAHARGRKQTEDQQDYI